MMEIYSDLHVHSTFCDGKDDPEAIIQTAISRGMKTLGFSSHAHTPFYEEWCMSPSVTEDYKKTIRLLQKKYASRIRILLGTEWDYYSDGPRDGYDYLIGSVHFLPFGDEYIPVDESPDVLLTAANKYANGDMLLLAEKYFELVSQIVEKTNCDIIGHFDLITKFNEKVQLFDEQDPRYIRAWQKACDRLLSAGKTFEINTGAISRGWRTTPYPSSPILKYLKEHGASFMLNSDSHQKETIMAYFEQFKNLPD